MKKDRSERRLVSAGDIIFVLLMTLCFGIKLRLFYPQFRLGGFDLGFTLVSCAMFIAVFAVINLFSAKAARVVITVLYCFFSIAMAIDAVYFGYTGKFPSVVQLAVIWMLGGVESSVDNLITFTRILPILDLPVWMLWLINRGFLREKTPRFSEKLTKKRVSRFIVSGVAAVIAALLAVYVFCFTAFRPEYMENELMSYHAIDIYKSFFAPPTEREVDKDLYTEDVSGDSATVKSEYYGIAEGRNVIIIQVEAMQNFVIGAEYDGQVLTENLNSLIENDSIYFDNYYYLIGGGNTADAEFTMNNSLFPVESEATYTKYPKNDYFGLPKLLKANGYTGAYAFHGYVAPYWNREEAYPYQGFDDFTSLEDLEQTEMFPMGLSDMEFFRQSTEIMKTYEEPFYSFLITLSSHYPFALPTEARDIVLKDEDYATLFGLYIQSMNYVDRAIGQFIDELKEAGLYDNSIIVIYGDHYALTNTSEDNATKVKDMLGRPYTIYDVFNIPMIIHIPGLGRSEKISIAGSHIDTLPTLLCLLGIENDKAVMFGQNLLEAESGFVCEQTHMQIGSFISDEVFFKKPYNNIKTNYDAYERGTMRRLDPDDFEELSEYAANRIYDCQKLLETNSVLLEPKE